MAITLRVYANEDDTLLVWSVPAAIPNCLGFAIQRKGTIAGKKVAGEWLTNRVGFAGGGGKAGDTKPSTDWPFQRFTWTDHAVNTSDVVSYRVVPMIGTPTSLKPASEDSGWSTPLTLGSLTNSSFQPYFNRGFVISQFMTRYLKETGKTLDQFKATIKNEDDQTIRRFLSGDLRVALLRILQDALHRGHHVYAALFELTDDELVQALVALGPRAHLVLANGSITKGKTETSEEARKRDANAQARAALTAAEVDVGETDRFISPGALGHNKFLVVADPTGTPKRAWTGSTNWSPTGLCTQVNNGLEITDGSVAKIYLDQWKLLRKANSAFPPALVDSNSKPKVAGQDHPGTVRSTVWFTRTRNSVDLAALRAEVAAAQQGILFLMFMPGATGVLGDILSRAKEPNLCVRGVVSTLPGGGNDESEVDVSLVNGDEQRHLHLEVIEPKGLAKPFAYWAEEVTRKQFLSQVGHAIIHSKVIVVDPFSADPTVISGSHNFSGAASTRNDENFIIVKGDKALAEAYAVNILGVWNHYRWRAQVEAESRPWEGLASKPDWMAKSLKAHFKELRFWGV